MYNNAKYQYEMNKLEVYSEPETTANVARLKEATNYFSTAGTAYGTQDTINANTNFKAMFFTQPLKDVLKVPDDRGTYSRLSLNYYCEIETTLNEQLNLNVRLDYYDKDENYISSSNEADILNTDHLIDIQVVGDALQFPANTKYIYLAAQNNANFNTTFKFKHATAKTSTAQEVLLADPPTNSNRLFVILGNSTQGTPAPIPPTNPSYETVTLDKASNPSLIFDNGSTTANLTYNSDDELNINGNLLFGGTEVLLNQDDNNKILTLSAKNASTAQFRIGNDPNKQLTYFYNTGAIYLSPSCRIFQTDTAFNDDCLTNKKYVDDLINTCVQLSGNQTVAGNKTFSGITSIEALLDMNNNKIENVATPTIGTDGANKAYVDSVAGGSSFNNNINLNGYNIEDVGEIQADKLTLIRPDGSLASYWIEQTTNNTQYVNMSGGSSSEHSFYCNVGGNPVEIFSVSNNEIKTIRELNMGYKRIEQVKEATTQFHAPNYGQLLERTANFQSYKIVLNDAFTANTYKTFVMDATIPVESYQTGTYILTANINLTIGGPGQTLADVFGRITVSNAVSGVNTDYGQIFMKEEPTSGNNYGHLTLSKVMTVSAAGNFPSWHVGIRSSDSLNMDVEIIYKMDRISN